MLNVYSPFDAYALGVKIRLQRIRLGISQIDLADRLVCTQSYMSRIEQGKASPSLDMMLRIAYILHLSLDETFVPEFSRDPKTHQLLMEVSALPAGGKHILHVLAGELIRTYYESPAAGMVAEPAPEYPFRSED